MSETASATPDPAITNFVNSTGLVRDITAARFYPLTGGVSSDIWLVAAERKFCVKRALPQLRVEAEWFAPVERSAYEAAWLKGAAKTLPQAVPGILAEDPDAGIFAMDYLDPLQFPCWKAELLGGCIDQAVAAEVGSRLGRIHSAFASDPHSPEHFATDAIFHSIRVEPYLLATARADPRFAHVLEDLAERTSRTKRTVAHGDISPKNILVGPRRPGFPGRRMRLVWRSGFRPCLLPQSPSVKDDRSPWRCGKTCSAHLLRLTRVLSMSRSIGSRSEQVEQRAGIVTARPPARPHRWQVPGRIYHQRDGQRPRAKGYGRPACRLAANNRRGVLGMGGCDLHGRRMNGYAD